jgi:hypothetical protein
MGGGGGEYVLGGVACALRRFLRRQKIWVTLGRDAVDLGRDAVESWRAVPPYGREEILNRSQSP